MENLHLDPNDVSSYPLKFLWYGRLHPGLDPCWTKILVPTNISVAFLYLILALKGINLSHNRDIFFTAECFQTCILVTHSIGKFSNFLFHKNRLLGLVEKKSQFWKLDKFDGLVYDECVSISNFVKKITRFYYFLNFLVLVSFDLQPFTTGYLPTVCYVPTGWFNFLTGLLWYFSWAVLFGLPGTDGFFCSLATSLIIQFKLLGHKFKTNSSEMKKLVDYHNYLLSYSSELNATFRPIFLLQFMISIGSASVSVFIFMQPGDWSNRIKFLLYFLATMVQTAFYCVPLEFVVISAKQIGDFVFESNWYQAKNVKFKKCFILILVRAQKSVGFSAYGLIWINLGTFLVICKTVFSFYTYLNSVNKIAS
ncbi:odorant receptor 85c-like [Tribolium madens]|uniref:odorant receptor 85c-like n=1 Tax=Tribolium madens TaxID=41895 RepID=UPI001CF74891|nr:odorant receptor 85c-like [Tribolium madens]